MNRGHKIVATLTAALALGIVVAGSAASAAPSVPRLASPRAGAIVDTVPPFAWTRVRNADHYEFEIAADSKFNSPVLGQGFGQFATYNTRATLLKTIPNGSYWWHVRAVTKNGGVSPWSGPRSLKKAWNPKPRLLWPKAGARVKFPGTPLTLRWSPVSGAAKYRVYLANDKELSSLVGGKPIETSASSLTPPLTPGAGLKTFYWSVAPIDAGGNSGERQDSASFEWGWPSETKVRLDDLRPEERETFDPQFSWDAVEGAAAYELDVNSSADWATGSRVCCTQPIIGTSWSPPVTFADNTYYWRVRALDANGQAGIWNSGPDQGSFQKVFDKSRDPNNPGCASSLSGCSSILNLHMRDNLTDSTPSGPTQAPVVVWDAVPGASSYFVEVVPFKGFCDWSAPSSSHWRTVTAVTAWTPLGSGLRAPQPYPNKMSAATELPSMSAGKPYCVRVRAQSDKDTKSGQVYGDFTYVNGNDQPAFTFAGYQCVTGCARGYFPSDDYYIAPQRGAKKTTTPFFTWRANNAASWFVIVAKDREFHTVVDYGFTQIPAFAPRGATTATTYSDELTEYYWAVLPASGFDGSGAVGDPLASKFASFNKQSIPPKLVKPADGASLTAQPVFQWSPVEGALRYHLQVSKEKDFGKTIDDIVTDSVSWTSNTSYPPDVALYWRVRAEDTNGVGLTWSTQMFKYHLARPTTSAKLGKGDELPTWTWKPVTGAVSYDVHVALPNGTNRDFSRIPSAAFTPTKMTGTGIFSWSVRANFSKGRSGVVSGPYSKPMARFTRTIQPPARTRTTVGVRALVLWWSPKRGAKSYRVQVASRPDFSRTVENTQTTSPAYAPLLKQRDYLARKRLFWRVAAVDEDGNQGNYAKPLAFRLPRNKR